MHTDPPSEPVDVSSLEMPRGEVGEIIICGWHVNTHQVTHHTHASTHSLSHTHQVAESRLVRDVEGKVWLRTEDAGYMDQEDRLWLVGRVKWRVTRDGKTFWSTAVEQKVYI